ncbi:unnamed protein product [Dicrocoelium dendriticum]|nr:unnamed protein product [Dicrocoelium dendriticum]
MDSHSPTFPSRTSTEIGFDALISTLRNETLPQPPQEPVNTTNVPIEMDWREGNECPDAVIIPNQTTLLMSAVPMSPFMMMEEEGEDPVPSFSLDTHEVQDRHRVYRKDDTELSQFPSLSKFASFEDLLSNDHSPRLTDTRRQCSTTKVGDNPY